MGRKQRARREEAGAARLPGRSWGGALDGKNLGRGWRARREGAGAARSMGRSWGGALSRGGAGVEISSGRSWGGELAGESAEAALCFFRRCEQRNREDEERFLSRALG